jgi:hypothetical protein
VFESPRGRQHCHLLIATRLDVVGPSIEQPVGIDDGGGLEMT